MKCAFRKKTGAYIDNEQSCGGGAGFLPANLERFSLTADDVVVIDVPREDHPWDKKFVNGKIVPDTEKLNAKAQKEAAEQAAIEAKQAALASAKSKLKGIGLTNEEIEALIGEKGS